MPADIAQPGESNEPKNAALEAADFDALTRTTMRAEGPALREAKDALFTAAFKLEMWHFIARGEAPDYHAYGARNAGIENGAPMLKAFTDAKRLQEFAKENQLVDEKGAVLILSLPVSGIQPTLDGYAEMGVTHVHFNANRASDGFYIPIAQLPVLRRHLEGMGLL